MTLDSSVNSDQTYDRAKPDEDDSHATSQLLEKESDDSLPYPEKKCVQPGGLKVIIIASIIFALAVTIALVIDIYTGEHYVGHGVVSSDSVLCSNLGKDILKKGGSAVDAAIATSLCVGVVCPESSGIGGGGFMLVQSPEGEMKVIDFRETAPLNATEDMFSSKSSQTGGLAVAVPGQVRGFEMAHKKFGKLKWNELFTPVINIATNGFEILNSTKKWLRSGNLSDELQKYSPEFLSLFFQDKTLKQHTKRPKLAKTLKVIADQGAAGFYSGDIANGIVKTIMGSNGILNLEDLRNYTAIMREPLSSVYQNYRIFTSGPPTSGSVLISAMNILEGFNLTKANASDPLIYHYIVETLKFVYAQRSHLADPNFVDMINITNLMLSKEKANELRERIHDNKTETDPNYYGELYDAPPNMGTSHVTVIDRKGGIASVTSTINGPFGSKLCTDSGILLNNEMDDFSSPHFHNEYGFAPSKDNFIKPRKRPLSSICPVIALDQSDLCGRQIVLGGEGGSHITSAVIQVLLNMLTFGRSLEDAIEWPRVHHQLDPMYVEIEGDRFSKRLPKQNITQYLKEKGNKVVDPPKFNSVVNGASKYDGHLVGHADSRRDGGGIAVY